MIKHKKKNLVILVLTLLVLVLPVLFSRIGQNFQAEEVIFLTNPLIKKRDDVKIQNIETGIFETLESFVIAGGSFFKIQKGSHNSLVIFHPKGNLLLDTGIGKDIDVQFEEMPFYLKPLFGYKKIVTAFEKINSNKIKLEGILVTHLHWDHASGIKEFSNLPIYVTELEYEFSHSTEAKPPAYIKSQYEGVNEFKKMDFNDGAYEIFTESFDFYKDGSIIIVKLFGHSPGSIGVFVNISPTQRYFFTGDLTWSNKGYSKLSHKFYISSLLVDLNREAIEKEISRISQLIKRKPEIKVIPAHDSDAFSIIEKIK